MVREGEKWQNIVRNVVANVPTRQHIVRVVEQCFHNRAVEGGTVSHKKRNHTWIVGLVAGVSVLVIVLVSGLAMLMYSKWKDNSTNSDKNIIDQPICG